MRLPHECAVIRLHRALFHDFTSHLRPQEKRNCCGGIELGINDFAPVACVTGRSFVRVWMILFKPNAKEPDEAPIKIARTGAQLRHFSRVHTGQSFGRRSSVPKTRVGMDEAVRVLYSQIAAAIDVSLHRSTSTYFAEGGRSWPFNVGRTRTPERDDMPRCVMGELSLSLSKAIPARALLDYTVRWRRRRHRRSSRL